MVKKKLTKSAQVRRKMNGDYVDALTKVVVDNFPKVGDNVGGLVLTDMGNGKLKWIRQAPASIPIPNYLKPDMVNNPPYYKRNGIEVVDVIEAFELNFRLANVMKYVLRHVGKDGVEDLKKAQWYLNREISKHE